MNLRYLIDDLERRFRLIMEMGGKEEGDFLFNTEEINAHIRATRLDHPLFFGAIHDYIGATKKAISVSEKFHIFDHEEHSGFEEEVCKKIMNDESIPQTERNRRVSQMTEFYFAPTYDALCQVADRIEKGNDMQTIVHSLPLSGSTYREYLKRVHPAIIAVLEEELAVNIPVEESKSQSTTAEFDENISKLTINGHDIKLPSYKNEFYLCRVLFQHRSGEPIDWSEVYEDMTGNDDIKNKDSAWRKIYDASLSLNKRVKELAGIENYVIWDNKTLRRSF